ncbi:hypothetical protein BCR35DRAFT_287375 [Leucosporidium creatinivorum]|uniref:CDP-diacylglycerol--glycerol-3-phosphate 3-phosphatidyltransferase n=1 Tax=Leucosporidium creatinivorum TaxID=106004 RepID=A0A1Y2G1V0_9BASI|nr:hypothetical protein BCR35DRAFT_287375 [Leucosporidium creatinivorum]
MLLRQSIRRQLPRPWATLNRQQLQPFSSRRTPLPRHPAYENLAESLQQLPHFRTRAEDVRVLNEPSQFYKTLIERISQAKRRIFIASLYIGKEETELIAALHSALKRNPSLELIFVVDYLRSTREIPKPTSASLIASLAAAFPNQVDLRLYHTPNLAGWKKRWIPRRFDEGWGLQHMKCYGFDDDVVMSGANLSLDYFTNRQDRYIEFRNHPALADYFQSLLRTVASYSFRALATDTTTSHPALSIVWPSSNPTPSFLDTPTSIPDLKAHAHQAFNSLTTEWALKPLHQLSSPLPPSIPYSPISHDTSLRPLLQMGTFNITQETDLVVPSIFRMANSLATAPGGWKTTVDWTSGYFSVRERYREFVLAAKANVRIMAASPEANGFTGSRGVSKYIPPAYTHLMKVFYEQANQRAARRRRETHIELREWKREGWTYHAKGIWLAPSHTSPVRYRPDFSTLADANDLDEELALSRPLPPYLTLIGSSNYGNRSAQRDLEANLLVTTDAKPLQQQLGRELNEIRRYATDVVNDRLFERKGRKVPWGVKVAAKAIEDML